MEPWPGWLRCPVVGGEWSAPTHLSWVAGVCPVEPHTEVADHVRLYDDGSGRARRSRALDPAGGGARRRAFGGADAARRRAGGRAAARRWPAARAATRRARPRFGLYRH